MPAWLKALLFVCSLLLSRQVAGILKDATPRTFDMHNNGGGANSLAARALDKMPTEVLLEKGRPVQEPHGHARRLDGRGCHHELARLDFWQAEPVQRQR